MKKLLKIEIESTKFLIWFFKTGCDKEQVKGFETLGKKIFNELLKGKVNITAYDILNECEHTVIPVNTIKGFETIESDIEIGDFIEKGFISPDFQIKLIF